MSVIKPESRRTVNSFSISSLLADDTRQHRETGNDVIAEPETPKPLCWYPWLMLGDASATSVLEKIVSCK